jgi:hypothetical protein
MFVFEREDVRGICKKKCVMRIFMICTPTVVRGERRITTGGLYLSNVLNVLVGKLARNSHFGKPRVDGCNPSALSLPFWLLLTQWVDSTGRV